MSVNRTIHIGNLGRDPEIRYLPDGSQVTNISIACTEKWKDRQGNQQEATEWVSISFFGKLAEIAGQYLKKGSQVYVEGKLQTRKYTDKEGIERYATSVIASEMRMLGGKPDNQKPDRNSYQDARNGKAPARTTKPSDMDDDPIPF